MRSSWSCPLTPKRSIELVGLVLNRCRAIIGPLPTTLGSATSIPGSDSLSAEFRNLTADAQQELTQRHQILMQYCG